jgi:hypothetical protein
MQCASRRAMPCHAMPCGADFVQHAFATKPLEIWSR